jgi:hypothetical protein
MTEHDPRTPGRAGPLASQLGRADLIRRLSRLSLGEEALPRVLRLVEDEVAAAVASYAKDAFSASEVEAAGGDTDLVSKLRSQREDERRVAAIRSANLHTLTAEQLEGVLTEARSGARN